MSGPIPPPLCLCVFVWFSKKKPSTEKFHHVNLGSHIFPSFWVYILLETKLSSMVALRFVLTFMFMKHLPLS